MNQTEQLEGELRIAQLKAWLVLTWERLWPLLVPFACVVALFLIISWLGGWPYLHDVVRWLVVAGFAAASIWSLRSLASFRMPTRQEINFHIERYSGLSHRPVSAQEDSLADLSGNDDAFSQALWAEHRHRMASGLNDLKSGLPDPKVAVRDPYALRAIVGLVLFVALFAGWGNLSARLGDAFRSHAGAGQLADLGRVDAWIKPPLYTNKPPIFLNRSGAAKDSVDANSPVLVPQGSELVIRLLDLEEPGVKIVTSAGEQVLTPVAPEGASSSENAESAASLSNVAISYQAELLEAGTIVLFESDAEKRSWQFSIIPDSAPVVEFSADPSTSAGGQLELAYVVEDDYGVSNGVAEIEPVEKAAKDGRPLYEKLTVPLSLPSRRAKKGTGKTTRDVSEHPLAGGEVAVSLKVSDDAGQSGMSATKTTILPGRVFTKPLAKALIFERRRLAMDANRQHKVADVLDVITTTHPDIFIPKLAHYTAMRVAYRQIKRAQSDDALREGLDLLWQIALSVENGDLSLAEQRLRDAQERLADALERGASDKEIEELMKELREAMNNFLKELREQFARNQQNQPNQQAQQNENTRILRQQDLDEMLKRMEDLAKSGSKDAARELLRQMQEMLNNLQMAQPQQNQQQTDPFSQQMNELGEMMQRQQELMDQTFDMQRRQQQRQNQQRQGQQDQNGQRQRNQQQGQQQQQQPGQQQGGDQGQQPMTAEEFAEAMKRLQEQQGKLQQQMEQMQQSMRELGLNPGESMNDAGEAMGQAEGNLGEGQTGEATENQGRALQSMREGAQRMMQQMQEQAGEQGRRGERGQHGEQTRRDSDPLGRQSRSRGPQLGDETKVPNEIDAQRAREILDAIRKRLGEAARPKLELDYLDRLLPSR